MEGKRRCFSPQALWTPASSYEQNLKVFTEEMGMYPRDCLTLFTTAALCLCFPLASVLFTIQKVNRLIEKEHNEIEYTFRDADYIACIARA